MSTESSGSEDDVERSNTPLIMISSINNDRSNNNNDIPAIANEAPAPVPDVLLSLAKDDRYISEVFSLLSQAIVPFASILFARSSGGHRNISNDNAGSRAFNADETLEDNGKQFVERIRPELNLLASILVHSATFVFYTRNLNVGDQVQDAGVFRSIGIEALNLSYRLPRGRNCLTVPSHNTSKLIRVKERIASTLSQMNAWHRLLFLQTVVPYIINRVDRGGWSKDLKGLLSTLLKASKIFTNSSSAQEDSETNNEPEERAFRNNDMLRGSARRRLFHEQRRRMMNTSNDNSSSPLSASNDSEVVNEGTNTMQSSQAVHRENASLNEGSENVSAFKNRLNQFSRMSWEIIRHISAALSSLNHGAHQLPRHIGSIENHDKYTNILQWLLRLHLALFYWNGMYPTITHRIAGAKFNNGLHPSATASSPTQTSGAIVANRPSYKPIAALILLQTASALLQTAASASIELAHKLQITIFRWSRNRRAVVQGQHGRSLSSNDTESERAEYLDLIESRVPGIDSSKASSISMHKRIKSNKELESHSACGICLNKRIHPAVPSKCGHVFCWNCIMHWVVNVREECPLCRSKTRRQDVIPLYNYT